MVDQNTLPEGTDKVIAGAARSEIEEELIVKDPTTRDRMVEKVRSEGSKLSGQAADKARGLVGQGLERSSEALGNVSKLIGDTAASLDDRLGGDYGNYARKAAGALEDAANRLASKDADELIDDTRQFVRKSPGIALGIAAVAGFALARLVQSGFDAPRRNDDEA